MSPRLTMLPLVPTLLVGLGLLFVPATFSEAKLPFTEAISCTPCILLQPSSEQDNLSQLAERVQSMLTAASMNLEDARRACQAAVVIAQAEKNRPMEAAEMLDTAGWTALQRGYFVLARPCLEAAQAMQVERIPDSLPLARTCFHLGELERYWGAKQKAQEWHETARQIRATHPQNLLDYQASRLTCGLFGDYYRNVRDNLSICEAVLKGKGGEQRAYAQYLATLYCYTVRGRYGDEAEHLMRQFVASVQARKQSGVAQAMALYFLETLAHNADQEEIANAYSEQVKMVLRDVAQDTEQVAPLAWFLDGVGGVNLTGTRLAKAQDYCTTVEDIWKQNAPGSIGTAITSLNSVKFAIVQVHALEARLKAQISYDQAERAAPGTLPVAQCRLCQAVTSLWSGGMDTIHSAADLLRLLTSPGPVIKADALRDAEGYIEEAYEIASRLPPYEMDMARILACRAAISYFQSDLPGADKNTLLAAADRDVAEAERIYLTGPHTTTLTFLTAMQYFIALKSGRTTEANTRLQQVFAAIQSQPFRPKSSSTRTDQILEAQILAEMLAGTTAPEATNKAALQQWQVWRDQMATLRDPESDHKAEELFGDAVPNVVAFYLSQQRPQAAFDALEESRALQLRGLLLQHRLLPSLSGKKEWTNYQQSLATLEQRRLEQAQASARFVAVRSHLPQVAPSRGAENIRAQKPPHDATVRLGQIESRYVQARMEAERRLNALLPCTSVPPVSPSSIQNILKPGDVFASFCVGRDKTYLFLLTSPDPQPRIYSIQYPDLAKNVQLYHQWISEANTPPDQLAKRSHELFSALFPSDARQVILSAQRIIIAPDGPLWRLPFAALITNGHDSLDPRLGGQFADFARRKPIAYLGLEVPLVLTPSLSIYAQECARIPETHTAGEPMALVLGGARLDLQQGIFSLPAQQAQTIMKTTKDEAQSVAQEYSHTHCLTGDQATESLLRRWISQADVIHLATHGLFQEDHALESGVALTPSRETSSAVSTRNDGVLQAWEILSQLHLRAQLVVLSACETGRGQEVRNEGIFGLTSAFQAAGCHAVIASHWKVDTETAKTLMTTLHKRLRAGIPKDEALRQAMRAAYAQHHPQPHEWAAFFLMGDPAICK